MGLSTQIASVQQWIARPDALQVNVGGVWKKVKLLFVNVGGNWRRVYENITPSVPGGTISDNINHVSIPPQYPYAKIIVAGAGFGYTLTESLSGGGAVAGYWAQGPDGVGVRPQTLDTIPWEIRCTLLSGTLYTADDGLGGSDSSVVSDAVGTWLSLSGITQRKWKAARRTASIGTTSAQVQLDIRIGATILASGTYTLNAQVS